MATIEDQLILHEGLRLKPYRCTENKLTIGVGRNIEERGITATEAMFLLKNDIEAVEKELSRFDWFTKQDEIRRRVLIDMGFMGVPRLLGFKKMIQALVADDYEKAAAEMLDSKWSRQVGGRAVRLAEMMRTGKDYDSKEV
jgi:lysozyme